MGTRTERAPRFPGELATSVPAPKLGGLGRRDPSSWAPTAGLAAPVISLGRVGVEQARELS